MVPGAMIAGTEVFAGALSLVTVRSRTTDWLPAASSMMTCTWWLPSGRPVVLSS
jgi:hypothetical protein